MALITDSTMRVKSILIFRVFRQRLEGAGRLGHRHGAPVDIK